ncbi:unnamed protein product [Urochloa humidicola]
MGITVDLGRNASVLPSCSWGRTRGYSNRYGRQWLSHATEHGGPVQPPTPQSTAGLCNLPLHRARRACATSHAMSMAGLAANAPAPQQLEWVSIWTTPSSCSRKCLQDENIHRGGSACKW